MRKAILLAAFLPVYAASAVPPGQTAIKCVGKTKILPQDIISNDTHIYIIDDKAQSVARWDTKDQAKVAICLVGECPKKFGVNHIRFVQDTGDSSMMLDIERDTGEILYFERSSSPASMTSFEGICSKTILPRSNVIRKF